MKTRTFIKGILFLFIVLSMACATLSNPLSNLQPTNTPLPNEEATINAVITEINAPPSFVAWIGTVNAIGTEGFGGTGSPALDGKWIGEGFTVDNTDIKLTIIAANGYITDISIEYLGSAGQPCLLSGSATNPENKVDFLPAQITLGGIVTIPQWGFTASLFEDGSGSGGIGAVITDHKIAECNLELKGVWTAEKE